MIAKRSMFAHRNAINAQCGAAFRVASYLQSELARLAFDFSARPERSAPWDEVRAAFAARSTCLWETAEADFRAFVKASKAAHRLESSIMVEQKYDSEAFVCFPLTLRIKFYYRNNRKEFLEWKLTFDEAGHAYKTSLTGHAEIGAMVMEHV